jgi:type III pantothenate kinase
VDRALAGWQAWRTGAGPVLVADAGTVMSLTRVDGNGRFTGGRLQAGVLLQTRAMVTATVSLPGSPTASPGPSTAAGDDLPAWQRWPSRTRAAMEVGVRAGLAAAVATAAREAAALEAGCRLVLTGGDGPLLWTMIRRDLEGSGISCDHRPDLCLEAMVGLRPLA